MPCTHPYLPNEYALLAWQSGMLERARKVMSQFELYDCWLPELAKLIR